MASLNPIPIAQLSYDAQSRWLIGSVGRAFRIYAHSGGGRGSKHPTNWQSDLRSHLATTKEEKDAHGRPLSRGGTLPPGLYACQYVAQHPTFHECVRLLADGYKGRWIFSPAASQPIPHHRDGFYIHGRGPLGSDGCIVPWIDAERSMLTRAIRDFPGLVTLNVKNVGYMLPAERFDGRSA